MKYTNPDYYKMSRYKKIDGGNINILNGPDETCALGLLMGADGAIGSTYNVMPRLFVKLFAAVKEGRADEALRLQMRADEVIECMLRYDVISCVKLLLSDMGYDVGEPNAPLKCLSEEEKTAFRASIRALDLSETLGLQ